MKLSFIAIVFQNNQDGYRLCCERNMPPFYSYEKLTQISSETILVKRDPGPLADHVDQGQTAQKFRLGDVCHWNSKMGFHYLLKSFFIYQDKT